MRVCVDGWAWLEKAELTSEQLETIKNKLTIIPRKVVDYGDDDDNSPLYLFQETETRIGVAREYFFSHVKQKHDITIDVSCGDKSEWPGDLRFNPEKKLRKEQQSALDTIVSAYRNGKLGGILKAFPAFGKTVVMCALIAELGIPTLVVVHKEFLVDQWRKRLEEFLPGVKIGLAQQDVLDYRGKHVVIGMIHTLAKRDYSEHFRCWPGLAIVDETHRVGARSWAPVPAKFPTRFRIGVSGTPRRKDGAQNVFFYHIGPILFTARENRLKPKIKTVHTQFKLVKTPNFNPSLASEPLLLQFLCANEPRNKKIVALLIEAVRAGRNIIVLSKRLDHLRRLEAMLRRTWPAAFGPCATIGYYIGGMDEEGRELSSTRRVILATSQMAAEGLDIPWLDTLFLTCPMGDVEQAAGRILRPYEGKKEPIVVDFRDDLVPRFKRMGESRARFYEKLVA